jgi:hypothetical protein
MIEKMTSPLGEIVDPKTIRVWPMHLKPGDCIPLPESMTFIETSEPPPFQFRVPVRRKT